jgi:hypothetical protein
MSTARTLLAVAGVAATALVPAAAHAAERAPQITGAIAFPAVHPGAADDVLVTFRTATPLPRRADGLIQAQARYAGRGGSSLSSFSKHGHRCYQLVLPRKALRTNSTHTLALTVDGRSATRRATLRAKAGRTAQLATIGC